MLPAAFFMAFWRTGFRSASAVGLVSVKEFTGMQPTAFSCSRAPRTTEATLNGRAFSLSADGKFIAGLSSAGVATRWDAQRRPHAVSTLIPAAVTANWTLGAGTSQPVLLSADGGTIAGGGQDPSPASHAWIVRAN